MKGVCVYVCACMRYMSFHHSSPELVLEKEAEVEEKKAALSLALLPLLLLYFLLCLC